MEQFNKFVHEYGLAIIFLSLWSVLRFGKRNRQKYERWDRLRKKLKKRKK